MDFVAVVDQAIALLRQRGRVGYRTLKRQFQLNDEALEDLKHELIDIQRVAADEENLVLIWRADPTDTLTGLLSLIRSLISSLPDTKYLLAVPVWFYIVGLVISNIHLGSLGIVSFDVLKARYIAVGILATIFFSLSLIHAYISLISSKYYFLPARLLINLLWSCIFVFFPTFIIANFTGDSISFINYIDSNIKLILGFINGYLAPLVKIEKHESRIIIALLTPSFTTAIVLRGIAILSIWSPIQKEKIVRLGKATELALYCGIAGIILVILVAFLPSFARELTNTTKIGDTSDGWGRFSSMAFLLSFWISSLGACVDSGSKSFLNTEATSTDSIQAQSVDNSIITMPVILYIFIIFGFAVAAIQVYSLGVYPHLSQRSGGGSVIPVQVATSLKRLCEQSTNSSIRTYLVDHTSSSTILQLANGQELVPKDSIVIEVAKSQMKSIVYKPDGKAEPNDCGTDSDQKVSK